MGQFDPSRLNTDPAARDAFVAAIDATGTLGGAAAATGTALSTAFRRRRRDPAFGEACEDALARRRGWKLEAALIDRAINGVARERTYRDGRVERWVEHDHRLGMFLLAKLKPDRYGPCAGTGMIARPRVMSRDEFNAAIDALPDAPASPPAGGG